MSANPTPITITYRPGAEEMNPPTDLPRPYKHEMPVATYRQMVAALKAIPSPGFRYGTDGHFPRQKPTKYGSYLSTWLLGDRPGAVRHDQGFTEEEWDGVCASVTETLRAFLPGITVYKEPWSPSRKFQFYFETYIRFSELAP